MKKLSSVEALPEYQLLLIFENKEKRMYDMSQKLVGIFEFLKDVNEFQKVTIINGAPTWILKNPRDEHLCSEIDICPDSAYLESKPV